MNTPNNSQLMSDEFHAITADLDLLLGRIGALAQLTAQTRIDSGMTGVESQRVIKHITGAMPQLAEARNSVTLGHAAAEKAGETVRAAFPWDCPDAMAQSNPVPTLQAVKG